jgi:V/A-type H+-transporting ATPase subunit C
MLENVRYIALGTEPLVAYYLGKEAEIRDVRIILSAKQVGLTPAEIRARLRRLYV